MVRLKTFPWLSGSLLFITYSTFGWIVAQSSRVWSQWLIAQAQEWGWLIEEGLALVSLYVLAVLVIVLIAIILTTPFALLSAYLGRSLKSDTRMMISILTWAFVFVVILRWIDYFTELLLLLCSAILAQLALRASGYNEWQTFLLLSLICLCGFSLGALTFKAYG